MDYFKKKERKLMSDEEVNNIVLQLTNNIICLLDTCTDSRYQSCNNLIHKINDLKYLSYDDLRTDEEKIVEQYKILNKIADEIRKK